MMLQLRDYQLEAHRRIEDAEARGARKQLAVLATGLGKTVIFSALAEKRQARTLILAHRDELVGQAVAKVAELWPDLVPTPAAQAALHQQGRRDLAMRAGGSWASSVGIVKADARDVRSRVVVASVQTLARQARLDELVIAQSDTSLLGEGTSSFELVVV